MRFLFLGFRFAWYDHIAWKHLQKHQHDTVACANKYIKLRLYTHCSSHNSQFTAPPFPAIHIVRVIKIELQWFTTHFLSIHHPVITDPIHPLANTRFIMRTLWAIIFQDIYDLSDSCCLPQHCLSMTRMCTVQTLKSITQFKCALLSKRLNSGPIIPNFWPPKYHLRPL